MGSSGRFLFFEFWVRSGGSSTPLTQRQQLSLKSLAFPATERALRDTEERLKHGA
jgi:hypothetical protein